MTYEVFKQIITNLEGSNPELLRLYFIFRRKNGSSLEFELMELDLETSIAVEIKNTYLGFLRFIDGRIGGQDSSFSEYNVNVPYTDTNMFTIDASEIPYYNRIKNDSKLLEFDMRELKSSTKIWGYLVYIRNGDSSIEFFKKSTQNQILKPNRLSMMLRGDQARFQKVTDPIFSLERKFDVAIIEINGEKKSLILNKGNFEMFFSVNELYSSNLEEKKPALQKQELIDDTEEFLEICGSDLKKQRKLLSVMSDTDRFTNLNISKIQRTITEYKVQGVSLKNNKLEITRSNIWTVLKLLDDDYLKSSMTDIKYETYSKKRAYSM